MFNPKWTSQDQDEQAAGKSTVKLSPQQVNDLWNGNSQNSVSSQPQSLPTNTKQPIKLSPQIVNQLWGAQNDSQAAVPAQNSGMPNLITALTQKQFPGTPVPTLGNVAKDIPAGLAELGQNFLKQSPVAQLPGGLLFGQSMQNPKAIQDIANYPVAQKLGIPATPANLAIQKGTQLGGTLLASLMGAPEEAVMAESISPSEIPIGSENEIRSIMPSAQRKGFIFKSKPNSQEITNALVSKDFPNFFESEMKRSDDEYDRGKDYVDGEKSGVNISPYLQSQKTVEPFTHKGMFDFMYDPSEVEKFSDQFSQHMRNNYPELYDGMGSIEDEAPSIFPKSISNGISPDAKKLYASFMKDPYGKGAARKLINLRSQLGSDAAKADEGDISGTMYKYNSTQARNIVDSILEKHLGQDPTGNALKGWRNGNFIRATSVYPMQSNRLLEAIMNGDVRDAEPNELMTAVKNANRYGKLPYDHPITQAVDNLKNKIAEEKAPPGLLKKTLKRGGLVGLGLLGGDIFRH